MIKLSYILPLFALWFSFGFKSDQLPKSNQQLVSYPLKGTFTARPSAYPESVTIDYWVHDLLGNEIYYSNHAIGIGSPKEHIQLFADKEYISLMLKNANQIYLRKR